MLNACERSNPVYRASGLVVVLLGARSNYDPPVIRHSDREPRGATDLSLAVARALKQRP